MRKLFDEMRLDGMRMANRVIRSATWEGMADPEGRPTPKLAAYNANLAKGGVGLIITGYAFIREDGKQLPGQVGIHRDDFAADYRAWTEAVHREGGKICLQLVHGGGQADSRTSGHPLVAPSAVEAAQYSGMPSELSVAEIEELVKLFAAGARRAREYGFDAVQLHAAHGYLINQFLSPLTNQREDEYGGSVENRCRFLIDVYRAVREAVGDDFPILVKLNGSDNLSGGLDIEDAVEAARLLDEEGVSALEVSGGTPASGALSSVRQKLDTRADEAYNLPLAARIKGRVTCPVIVVGGLKSFEIVDGIVRREEADFVALSRPFIREPHLVRRWQEGDEERARCISCNGCFRPGLREGGIYCVVDKIERQSRISV